MESQWNILLDVPEDKNKIISIFNIIFVASGCYNTIRTCLEYCQDCVASYVIPNSDTATEKFGIHDWYVTTLCCIAPTVVYMLYLHSLVGN